MPSIPYLAEFSADRLFPEWVNKETINVHNPANMMYRRFNLRLGPLGGFLSSKTFAVFPPFRHFQKIGPEVVRSCLNTCSSLTTTRSFER